MIRLTNLIIKVRATKLHSKLRTLDVTSLLVLQSTMSQPSADFPEITVEYCCFQDQVRNGELSPDELKKKFWSLYEEDPGHFNWCIATYHGSDKHDDVVTKNSRYFQMKTSFNATICLELNPLLSFHPCSES